MKLPQISEAEYEVMKIIWKYAPVSTNQVTEKLTQTTDWSPKTIQTMLKRLTSKGALSYEKHSRMFVYTPVFSEADYLRQKNTSFLDRYYNGNLSAMVSSFLTTEELSREELASLRTLLNHRFPEGGE